MYKDVQNEETLKKTHQVTTNHQLSFFCQSLFLYPQQPHLHSEKLACCCHCSHNHLKWTYFAPICRWFINRTFDTIMWTFDPSGRWINCKWKHRRIVHSSKISLELCFAQILQIMLLLLLDVGYVVPRDVSARYIVFLLMLGIFVGLAYQGKRDIVAFRFIIEYSSLRDFGPY